MQVDSDMGVVKAAHREQLIPVLTRILYAKLVQRKVREGGMRRRRGETLTLQQRLGQG